MEVAVTKETKPRQEGDVLGISQSPGSIPRANVPKGGHPAGIELDREHNKPAGTRDLNRGSGATGIDMGSGGEGTDIEPSR
jgi:hypothetical protein